MGEGRHEDDGGVGQEGLEDARVPAGDDAKDQSGEEDGGKCCCYHGKFLLRWNEWSSQCKPLSSNRETRQAAKMRRNLEALSRQKQNKDNYGDGNTDKCEQM